MLAVIFDTNQFHGTVGKRIRLGIGMVGEYDRIQRRAVLKGPLPNRRHTFRNGDVFESGAIPKCIFPDRFDAVGNGDVFQRFAAVKCTVTNFGYTIGNDDAR